MSSSFPSLSATTAPGIATRAIQRRSLRSGEASAANRPLVEPIAQTATFTQSRLRPPRGETPFHTYSRASNPTVAALEEALGAVSAAPPAISFASGLAATHALATALLSSGDHAIVGRASYGGTVRLFRELLAPLGIRTSFVDASDLASIAAALEPRTRLILIETPANPTLELADLDAIARLARAARVTFAADNTFLTAVHQSVLDLGAEVELLSTTKWIEGHHATIGGALITRDPALAERLRWIRKSLGAIQSPFGAWLTLQGVKTLPLRLRRHSDSALAIARWLDGRPGVGRVAYPGLRSHPHHRIARHQHRDGHGGVVALELADFAAADAFVGALEVFALAESLGGAESLVTHPLSMTHGDLPASQRSAAGITEGFLRLSIGLEDLDDLLRDLERGLQAAEAATPTRHASSAREVVRG